MPSKNLDLVRIKKRLLPEVDEVVDSAVDERGDPVFRSRCQFVSAAVEEYLERWNLKRKTL